jgi:hypothetical protein
VNGTKGYNKKYNLADEAKTARAKGDKAPKRTMAPNVPVMGFATPDTKCQRSGKVADATPLANDLSGTLIFTGTNMMPSVNEANPAMRLSATRHRVGHNCPQGSTCKMIHDLDITKWPDSTFSKWSALVDQTPALDWNQKSRRPRQSRSPQLQARIFFSCQLCYCQG